MGTLAIARLNHCQQAPYLSLYYCSPLSQRPTISYFSVPISSSITASCSSSSSHPLHPTHENSESPLSNFLNPLLKMTSFCSITVVSALLLVGFYQKVFIKASTIEGNPISIIEEEPLSQPRYLQVQLIRSFKLKEKIPIVHNLIERKPDDQAWKLLKIQVSSCSKELEFVRIGFEAILEKGPFGNKAYHDRVVEYLEMVDECLNLLKDITLAMDKCEKENKDVRYYLKNFSIFISRVRALQGKMLGALKYFQELEQE